ncbi:hypothetical protein [Halostella litorea]|uniref:hypothetical protein n=1 Tax=Halostella litorea TaxID=2528831 RepID=UPI001092ABCF|nr:hypothetical protein [Halostella litorea]
MPDSGDGCGAVSFATEGDDVLVRDGDGERALRLTAAGRSKLRPAVTDMFVFPVDDAVAFTASELRIGPHRSVRLRDGEGTDRGQFDTTPRTVPEGTHFLAVDGPVKLYVRVAGASFSASYAHGETRDAPLDVAFDGPTEVAVGARAEQARPAATITVPESPKALLSALSYMGSSMKEFSAERSWPSLRGHPPALAVGDALDVPACLSEPETGVTITVPPTYANAYRVAPLAFYLGASVESGDRAELRLDNGYVEPLRTDDRSLSATVEALLGRCLLLDSLVRVGGYYSLPRHEYDELAGHLPFYPPNLYDEPIADQLVEYLEVSDALIEAHRPRWPTTAVVRPRAADAELLPSLLDSLAPVRVSASAPDGSGDPSPRTAYVHGDPPAGSCRLVPASFEHARETPPPTPDEASVAVLTADAARAARLRALLDAEPLGAPAVTVRARTDGRAPAALAAGHDVLYCDLGDAPGDVPRAADAAVDARTVLFAGDGALPAAVDAVEAGGVGGVAVERPSSPRCLRALLDALVAGVPLSESVELAGLGDDAPFRLVGRPSVAAVGLDGANVPARVDVDPVGPDEHEVTVRQPVTADQRIGTCARTDGSWSAGTYQLNGAAATQPFRVSAAEVAELLRTPELVVRFNGRTYVGERDASAAFVRDETRRYLRARG